MNLFIVREFERLLLLLFLILAGSHLAHSHVLRHDLSSGRQLLSRPVGGGLGTSFGALALLWGVLTLLYE